MEYVNVTGEELFIFVLSYFYIAIILKAVKVPY